MSLLNRLGLNRHVTDADLTAVWTDARLGEGATSPASSHVRECPACRARLASLTTWLDGLRAEARQEADEAFPRERLALQQQQILRRLEGMERPAKVLTFPRFAKAISAPDAGRQRWIAAAAVAGLVVGIGLGQSFNFLGTSPPEQFVDAPQVGRSMNPMNPMERARGGLGIQPVSARSDEVFLYGQEPLLATERIPESLRSLHEITPSARDYTAR